MSKMVFTEKYKWKY